MAELTAQLADDVLAACRSNASDVAAALGRTFGGEFTLAVGEATGYAPAAPPSGVDGPGLVVAIHVGAAALAVVIPESSGWLPAWYREPQTDGKLDTLAQELSVLVLPDALSADRFAAFPAANLRDALNHAAPTADAVTASLVATTGGVEAAVALVWPLAEVGKLVAAQPNPLPAAPAPTARRAAGNAAVDFSHLPGYSRSLLRVRVPISVQLAGKKATVQDVVEIVAGSIIKFDKGCDELLQMKVGGQTVAEGEAVKAGDKFGFRVAAMLMPREHFVKVARPRAS